MNGLLIELRDLALRHATGRRTETAIPRLVIMKGTVTTGPMPGLYEPMLCLVLQGRKSVVIGDQLLDYDQASYFLASIEVPATGRIVEASPDRPYLALHFVLDAAKITELLMEMAPAGSERPVTGFAVSPVTPELADAWLRLLRLIENPEDIPVLAPMLEREILYRLLQGPQSDVLRQFARADGRLWQIQKAIDFIRSHYAEQIKVETLAEIASMSASVFHRHFKSVTAMSPVQYQKRIRLHEARRRLLSDPADTARVAFSVGYESATQFSREYSRLFGIPPARDAGRLRRGEAVVIADAAELA